MAADTKAIGRNVKALYWRGHLNDLAASVTSLTSINLMNEHLFLDSHTKVMCTLLIVEEAGRAECYTTLCICNLE